MNTTTEGASSAVRFLESKLPRCKPGTWYARNREKQLAWHRGRRAKEAAALLNSITPVTSFAWKQPVDGADDKIIFGVRAGNTIHWHSVTPSQACEIGRALLTAGGQKPDPGDWFLNTFRAARIDVRLGGMKPEDAAAKHGVDVELFTAWIAKLEKGVNR